jgi:hypothetical protein
MSRCQSRIISSQCDRISFPGKRHQASQDTQKKKQNLLQSDSGFIGINQIPDLWGSLLLILVSDLFESWFPTSLWGAWCTPCGIRWQFQRVAPNHPITSCKSFLKPLQSCHLPNAKGGRLHSTICREGRRSNYPRSQDLSWVLTFQALANMRVRGDPWIPRLPTQNSDCWWQRRVTLRSWVAMLTASLQTGCTGRAPCQGDADLHHIKGQRKGLFYFLETETPAPHPHQIPSKSPKPSEKSAPDGRGQEWGSSDLKSALWDINRFPAETLYSPRADTCVPFKAQK